MLKRKNLLQASVVQFLQMLLKEGKLSEDQALAYVDAIKRDIEVVEEKELKGEVERAKAQEQAKEERYDVLFKQNLFDVTKNGGTRHHTSLRWCHLSLFLFWLTGKQEVVP